MPGRTFVLLMALLLVVGCTADGSGASGDVGPQPVITEVTCDNTDAPSFPLAVLDQAGGVDPVEDQPAAILRAHLRDSEGLPAEGWIRAAQTADTVLFVARGGGVPWSMVKIQLRDGIWTADAWGECQLGPEVPPGVDLAVFRVVPDVELTPETTEIDVLVTEMACNSGDDARGRILQPGIIQGTDAVTVVMTVAPRGGAQECPGNPETPFLLELPEPLGERVLLDGSEVPARDATLCPARLCP